MSELRRLVMTIAHYRQEHDSWPTQARLGPYQIAQIAEQFGPSGLGNISERLDLRVIPDWDISVGGRSVIHYQGPEVLKKDGGEQPEAEAYRWLGFDFPQLES